jgi:hypothetical protein
MQDILDHADELAARFANDEFGADPGSREITRLGELYYAVRAWAEAERLVNERVLAAKAAGATWAQIGFFLGTSGEAARQKYGRQVAAGKAGPRKATAKTAASAKTRHRRRSAGSGTASDSRHAPSKGTRPKAEA